jgi:O-acetyl-ADP-ribose deacetylase (regulator of RNase III)
VVKYVVGDAANDPQHGIIVHVCNDIGGWGSGFVVPLGQRFPLARRRYRNWALANERLLIEHYARRKLATLPLGAVQFIDVSNPSGWVELWVGNMIAQRGVGGNHPLQYDALRACLQEVRRFAEPENLTIHMPRIGCGLAGGRWYASDDPWDTHAFSEVGTAVGPIVEEVLEGLDVIVYDLASVA